MADNKKGKNSKVGKNLFQRLTRLFANGPLVKRRVRDFKKGGSSATSLEVFRRAHSDIYSSTLSAYGSFDRLCIDKYTKIPVPTADRYLTLQELIYKYPDGQKFIVYAYDHTKKQLTPAWAHHPRLSGI